MEPITVGLSLTMLTLGFLAGAPKLALKPLDSYLNQKDATHYLSSFKSFLVKQYGSVGGFCDKAEDCDPHAGVLMDALETAYYIVPALDSTRSISILDVEDVIRSNKIRKSKLKSREEAFSKKCLGLQRIESLEATLERVDPYYGGK